MNYTASLNTPTPTWPSPQQRKKEQSRNKTRVQLLWFAFNDQSLARPLWIFFKLRVFAVFNFNSFKTRRGFIKREKNDFFKSKINIICVIRGTVNESLGANNHACVFWNKVPWCSTGRWDFASLQGFFQTMMLLFLWHNSTGMDEVAKEAISVRAHLYTSRLMRVNVQEMLDLMNWRCS